MASNLFNLATQASSRVAKTFGQLFAGLGAVLMPDEIWGLRKLAEEIHRRETAEREGMQGPAPGPQPGKVWEVPRSPKRTPAEPEQEWEYRDRRFSPLFQRPESSNVYSFQYDYIDHILYVQYKAPVMGPGASVKQGRIVGKLGSTVRSNDYMPRPHRPGFLYAYYGVPPFVFRTLIDGSSAGKGVWDVLRVRGTIHGTQYPYRLVQGAIVPTEDGQMGAYIPRRATNRGMRTRAVPVIGTGRRPYMRSSLPEELNDN